MIINDVQRGGNTDRCCVFDPIYASSVHIGGVTWKFLRVILDVIAFQVRF